jgi:Tfp pilus assembly protein PilX
MFLSSKSAALLVVLSVIILITAIAAVGINFTLSSRTLGLYEVNAIHAFCFAEAGIQKAMYEINKNPDPTTSSGSWTFAGQNITIAITLNGTAYDVTSEATYKTADKRIQAKIQKESSTVELLEWQQIN